MSASSLRGQAWIRAEGVRAQLLEFPHPTDTCEQSAAALGVSVGQIVKSLVFQCDGALCLVLVGGDAMVDSKKLSALLWLPQKKARRRQTGRDANSRPTGAASHGGQVLSAGRPL